MKYNEAAVYWLHLPEHSDPLTEGYIGVSKNPVSRMATHIRRASENRHHNHNLIKIIKEKGKTSIIKDIILYGQETFCYEVENDLRPNPNIGWNIAEGGRIGSGARPGVPKNKELIEKRRLDKIKAKQDREFRFTQGTATKEDLEIINKEKEKAIQVKKAQLKIDPNETISDHILGFRPICTNCGKNYCAINYIRKDKKYYRRLCDKCGSKRTKTKVSEPKWKLSGYKKKSACDLCGFKSIFSSQITVFHIDGNLENCQFINLRSICLNCIEVVKRKQVNWRRGDLQVDY